MTLAKMIKPLAVYKKVQENTFSLRDINMHQIV